MVRMFRGRKLDTDDDDLVRVINQKGMTMAGIDKFRPGFASTVMTLIKEVESLGVRAEKIVFRDGKLTVHAPNTQSVTVVLPT